MNPQDRSNQINPRYEEYLGLGKCWLWFLALGIVVMVVGVLAIGAPLVTTLTTVFVFGILLMAGGVVQIVNAFLARSWRGFFLYLLTGILHLVVGELLVEHPVVAAEGLTLVLAVAFLVGGALRLGYALIESFPGRGWVILNGAIALLLGISIWRQWPESSTWVIGLFIGIDLIFSGWSWVMLGLAVKALGTSVQPADSKAATSAPAGVH